MKKLLLGTTAIAAAGLAAGPALAQDGQIELSVGGYYQNFVSFVDQDDSDIDLDFGFFDTEIPIETEYNPVNVRHEGEIHFKGETTLDNGLVVGFQAQLEAITQGDQMDETYLYFSGSWGRLLMGSENSAPYLMSYAAPYAGLGLNSPNFFLFTTGLRTVNAATSGYLNLASDANKVTYFTPRFGGFQLGVSYTPNVDAVGGNRQTFGLNTDEDAGEYDHVFGAGANFVESFNGIDIAIFAGAEWANLEEEAVVPLTLAAGGPPTMFAIHEDDYQSYQAGLNIGFAGFTVGGSVSYKDFGFDDSFFDSDSDQWFYDVGATYTSGPWTVGVTYSYSDLEVAGGAAVFPFGFAEFESRRHMVEVGASYALSPGVTITAAGQYMHQKNEYSAGDIGFIDVDTDQKSDGWGATLGTKLSF